MQTKKLAPKGYPYGEVLSSLVSLYNHTTDPRLQAVLVVLAAVVILHGLVGARMR